MGRLTVVALERRALACRSHHFPPDKMSLLSEQAGVDRIWLSLRSMWTNLLFPENSQDLDPSVHTLLGRTTRIGFKLWSQDL